MIIIIILVSKRLYKYQHKKVNKNIFFVLIINFFRIKLRGKGRFEVKNRRNMLILNGFEVFYIDSVEAFDFLYDSVGIALPD